MKYRLNSRQRRHFFSGYIAYHHSRRPVRTYLRGHPPGHNAAAILLIAVLGLFSLAYVPTTGVDSTIDQNPTHLQRAEKLPLIGKFAFKPIEFLTKRGNGTNGAADSLPATAPSVFKHHDIGTTVFWVGEVANAENANIPNNMSVWDENWQASYGGVDDPYKRNGSLPVAFTPKENPFYFALPYSDLTENSKRKSTATNCANADPANVYSWCKNTWIAIHRGNRVAYAQWQDAGPLGEDDVNYVFGSAKPKNTFNAGAGLDVSPAVRDYLGLADIDRTDWTFVTADHVPDGPWKHIVTTSPGDARVW